MYLVNNIVYRKLQRYQVHYLEYKYIKKSSNLFINNVNKYYEIYL